MKTLNTMKVLVTPTSFGRTDISLIQSLENQVGEVIYNKTGKPLSGGQLKEMLRGVDGYIAGLDEINRDALSDADQLKVIARYGVGIEAVDLEEAKTKGIVVTNTPGANAASVAELTIGLMLSLARQIPHANRATKQGEWLRLNGVSLEGKVIGLLGLGAIGQQVAGRLGGFSCTTIAYDPIINHDVAESVNVDLKSMEEVVETSDFLSLHLPVLPETRHLVNADFLARMKDGAYLINTARGELIDEDALYEALQSGKLRGVAMDAFCAEPPDPTSPLLQLEQVITTPHTGAHTDSATSTMGRWALEDCLHVLRGEEPRFRVV